MQILSLLKEEILEQIISPIVIIRPDYSILFFNRAFATLTGHNVRRIKLGENLNNFLIIENLSQLLGNCEKTKSPTQNEERTATGKNNISLKILLKIIPSIDDQQLPYYTLTMLDISVETKLHQDFKTLASEKKNRRETEQRFLISNTLLSIRTPSHVIEKGCELLSQFYPNTKYLVYLLNEEDGHYSIDSSFPDANIKSLGFNKITVTLDFFNEPQNPIIASFLKTIFNDDIYILKPITKTTPSKAYLVITGIKNENNPEYSALNEFISLISSAYEKAFLYQIQLQYEQKLAQAKKMESLGLLAGGVAHDLNNILSGLVGYPDMLLMDTSKEDPNYETYLTIKHSGEKAASVVQDLLTLTRRGAITMKSMSINKIIEDVLNGADYQRLFINNPNATLKKDLQANLPETLCSEIHISRSFLNLLINAVEALNEKSGIISIQTSLSYLETPLENYLTVNKGEYICLKISDTGEGISEENKKRIFEPFFTTKKMSKITGTGLGLSIVWGALEDHNGYVTIDSIVGKGSTFKIYLPVTKEKTTREIVKVSSSKKN